MGKIIGLVLVALGGVLLYYGYEASNSMASELKKAIDGTPTDEARNYFIGGGVSVVVGLGMMFFGKSKGS